MRRRNVHPDERIEDLTDTLRILRRRKLKRVRCGLAPHPRLESAIAQVRRELDELLRLQAKRWQERYNEYFRDPGISDAEFRQRLAMFLKGDAHV